MEDREKGHRKSTHTHIQAHTTTSTCNAHRTPKKRKWKRKSERWETAIRHCRLNRECHRQLSFYRGTINMFLFYHSLSNASIYVLPTCYRRYLYTSEQRACTYNSLVLFRSCVKSQSTICHFNMSVSHIHHFIVLIVCECVSPRSFTFFFASCGSILLSLLPLALFLFLSYCFVAYGFSCCCFSDRSFR